MGLLLQYREGPVARDTRSFVRSPRRTAPQGAQPAEAGRGEGGTGKMARKAEKKGEKGKVTVEKVHVKLAAS